MRAITCWKPLYRMNRKRPLGSEAVAMGIRIAHFPAVKTLADVDFKLQPSLPYPSRDG